MVEAGIVAEELGAASTRALAVIAVAAARALAGLGDDEAVLAPRRDRLGNYDRHRRADGARRPTSRGQGVVKCTVNSLRKPTPARPTVLLVLAEDRSRRRALRRGSLVSRGDRDTAASLDPTRKVFDVGLDDVPARRLGVDIV